MSSVCAHGCGKGASKCCWHDAEAASRLQQIALQLRRVEDDPASSSGPTKQRVVDNGKRSFERLLCDECGRLEGERAQLAGRIEAAKAAIAAGYHKNGAIAIEPREDFRAGATKGGK